MGSSDEFERPSVVDGDGNSNTGDGDGDGDGGSPPPEMELEDTFRAPVVAGEYLWTANPETNKVARVNAADLEIEVLDAGHAPTYLAALPGGATKGGALVLNELSNDASIYFVDDLDRVVSQMRVPVQDGASAWSVGRGGRFAVAWSRSTEALLNSGDGYQDLTILDFRGESPQSVALSVGFRPSKVVLNEEETRAFVVSDPGISVIQLGDVVEVIRELFLPETEENEVRDVSFTPDGRLAMVRLEGESELLLVDTEENERVTVRLPGPVTDLDMSEDGTTAVAVIRGGTSEPTSGVGGMGGSSTNPGSSDSVVALLPTDTIFDSPDDFEIVSTTEVVGSAVVADDASQVLLFTNAESNHHLTILDTASFEMRVVDLKAPVQAAFLSEGGAYSVVLMSPPPQSSRQGAFALLPVAEELPPRIEGTDTPPEFVSISAESARVLVTTQATNTDKAVTYFGRFPGLQLDQIELPSKPLASGLVPSAGQGFVAQEHAEGRVTFVSLETGIEKTVTGFELSSKVVD